MQHANELTQINYSTLKKESQERLSKIEIKKEESEAGQNKLKSAYKKSKDKLKQEVAKETNSLLFDEKYEKFVKRAKKIHEVERCGSAAIIKAWIAEGAPNASLTNLRTCKDKLCPFCEWRKVLQRREALKEAMEEIERRGQEVKHLTLTVPNVDAQRLNGQIKLLHKAVRALMRKLLKEQIISGYHRSTEITYNENERTFHPHAHVLIISYFANKELIDRIYTKAFKEAGGDLKGNEKLITWISTTTTPAEAAKYTVKPEGLTEEAIRGIIDEDAIKNMRQTSTGGEFKILLKEIRERSEKEKSEKKEMIKNLATYAELEYMWEQAEKRYKLQRERAEENGKRVPVGSLL